MKTIATLLVTATLAAAPSAALAQEKRGFLNFLNAVAQAAEEGKRAHRDAREAAYYEQVAAYEAEAYGHGAYQGPPIFDLRGDWMRHDGKVNRFQQTHDGYYVTPVGRGRGVHYIEIGDNLYQDANSSGTYEVVDDGYMVWTSNDRRNIVIELFRR